MGDSRWLRRHTERDTPGVRRYAPRDALPEWVARAGAIPHHYSSSGGVRLVWQRIADGTAVGAIYRGGETSGGEEVAKDRDGEAGNMAEGGVVGEEEGGGGFEGGGGVDGVGRFEAGSSTQSGGTLKDGLSDGHEAHIGRCKQHGAKTGFEHSITKFDRLGEHFEYG